MPMQRLWQWLLPATTQRPSLLILPSVHACHGCSVLIRIGDVLCSCHAVAALTSSRDLSMNPSLSVARRWGQRSRKQCHLPAESAHTMYSLQQCTTKQPHNPLLRQHSVAAASPTHSHTSPTHCCRRLVCCVQPHTGNEIKNADDLGAAAAGPQQASRHMAVLTSMHTYCCLCTHHTSAGGASTCTGSSCLWDFTKDCCCLTKSHPHATHLPSSWNLLGLSGSRLSMHMAGYHAWQERNGNRVKGDQTRG